MTIEVLAWLSLLAGTGFFAAGTVGLLRFPDTLTRLHALTKADNAGLGLVALGLALRSGSWTTAAFLLLVWLLVLLASGTLSALMAAAAED
jgi:multicomponent Na+:H+ antiporter subunit G